MSRKLIRDLPRLLRVMFVTFFFLPISTPRKVEETSFLFSYTFCFEVSSKIGLHSKMLVFFQIVDPIFRFGS